jgi:hypothetical protein
VSYVAANNAIFSKEFATATKCMVLAVAFSMIFQALQTEVEIEDRQFKHPLQSQHSQLSGLVWRR